MVLTNLNEETAVVKFLTDLIRRRHKLPSQFAAEVGVSHASVHRWLTGQDIPNLASCERISNYSGVSLTEVLSGMGLAREEVDTEYRNWPEFREYARMKYSNVLDEDIISMIENLIERRRMKKETRRN
jgi:transcriptional regulator with XRE-family HTH domain